MKTRLADYVKQNHPLPDIPSADRQLCEESRQPQEQFAQIEAVIKGDPK